MVGTLSSVFGNNKLNSLRLGWTQEDVAFANPCFNGNGRDQAACEPTLDVPDVHRSAGDTAQARVNDAYQIENTFSWFLPARSGDHDIKFGAQYEYVDGRQSGAGQPERHLPFGHEQRAVRSEQSGTYPGPA